MEFSTMAGTERTNRTVRDAAPADEPGCASPRARETVLAGDSAPRIISAGRRAPRP